MPVGTDSGQGHSQNREKRKAGRIYNPRSSSVEFGIRHRERGRRYALTPDTETCLNRCKMD